MNVLLSTSLQGSASWHDGGLFMGMHWVWWSLWIVTIAVLLTALWRVFADRARTHRRAERREAAEEALRKRFAIGDIDEEEFTKRMRTLRDAIMDS